MLLAGLEGKLGFTKNGYLKIRHEDEQLAGMATYGPEAAAEAMPILKRELENKSPWLRISAAQAIWRITGEKESLPVLVETLNSTPEPGAEPGRGPDNYKLVRTIEAIGEMGPAARQAIPSLERVRRFSSAARRAVDAAIARIRVEEKAGNGER